MARGRSAKKSLSEPTIHFTPHSDKQSDLIFSQKDFTIAATGTQWGKSCAGALWLISQIGQLSGPDANFLIASPTYKIMAQSIVPYFLKAADGMGEYLKGDGVFKLDDGGTVYFRTETDPDSIVGIPNVRAYWLDEAGKVSLYFHENLQARAAAVGARGLYTTSPYSRNWLYKDYIDPMQKGEERPDVLLIQAASWDNPHHSLSDPEKRIKMRHSMDIRRFEMLFGGEWGKQAGLVYDCFDEENITEPFRLPNGTIFYGGIDWGHTEPFVLVIRAITPDNQHYQVSEFYKSGMTILDQIKIAKQKKEVFNVRHFFCGHERPENILLFNENGLPASAVAERRILTGTDLHYELIKTRRYKVFKDSSPYSIDEYESYHYPEPEDLKPDDDSKEQTPVGQNDHCLSGDTLVHTKQGKIPISLLSPGAWVLTRKGYAQVTSWWDNGERETVVTSLSNGEIIESTPNHLFRTARGDVRADALRLGDECITVSPWLRLSSSMGFFLGATLGALERTSGIIIGVILGIIDGEFVTSMLRYGSLSTGQCPMDLRSTIGMGTLSIIAPQISRPSPPKSTEVDTSANGGKPLPPQLEREFVGSGETPSHGIKRKQGELSTGMSANPYAGKTATPLPSYAWFVAPLFKPIQCAQRVAMGMLRNIVPLVVRTKLMGRVFVTGKKPGKMTRVFDLTVAGEPEYFAGGVLVHNCMSANRFVTLRTYRRGHFHKPYVPEEKGDGGAPQETQEKRFERLLRSKARSTQKSENWS